ncbi:hypothetical protein [Paraburkholderia rhizosphaerae]|uniref:Type III secretion system (T3SS) protein HrpB7 n=1 Tax=Paraburkholderia rhizosphaerae TaxID=480658 RepID=A0A4R8LKQ7_9BURK|nr:hypothetical protein [Paraburkholderia rhizosphaerae]TDY45157.1 type III secretion system (T3SS) protein HrpB7 [Paraburkholderia rhizosphaerae]
MKDALMRSYGVVMRRLERVDRKLRETLAAQRACEGDAQQQVCNQQDNVARANDELARHEVRIEGMMNGQRALRIDELLGWQEQRARTASERDALLLTLAQLRDTLAQIGEQIAQTRSAILRNDARIDLCKKRVTALRAQAQNRADDAQDEESEEGAVARRLASLRDARSAAAAAGAGR